MGFSLCNLHAEIISRIEFNCVALECYVKANYSISQDFVNFGPGIGDSSTVISSAQCSLSECANWCKNQTSGCTGYHFKPDAPTPSGGANKITQITLIEARN